MNRRALLASLGTSVGLLAGCQELGASARTTPPVTTPEPRTATDCTFHGDRTVSLAEMGGVPGEPGLDIEATLERNQITERWHGGELTIAAEEIVVDITEEDSNS